MDDVRKSTIRLTHWIDHNLDHLKGYVEMAEILDKEGVTEAAKHIRNGIGFIEEANAAFVKALTLLARESGNTPAHEEVGSSVHEHSHAHEHSHGHALPHPHEHDEHDHPHEHSHEHPHEHGHGHDHVHDEKSK